MDKTTFPQNFQYNPTQKKINQLHFLGGWPSKAFPTLFSVLEVAPSTTWHDACFRVSRQHPEPETLLMERHSFLKFGGQYVYIIHMQMNYTLWYVRNYILSRKKYTVYIKYKTSFLSTSFLTFSSRKFNKNRLSDNASTAKTVPGLMTCS